MKVYRVILFLFFGWLFVRIFQHQYHLQFSDRRRLSLVYNNPRLPPHTKDGACKSFGPSLPPVVLPPFVERKRPGPRPCPVHYMPVKDAIQKLPPSGQQFPYFKLTNLTYSIDDGAQSFGGHPNINERSQRVEEKMQVHCGFAKGMQSSGFTFDANDRNFMESCRNVLVLSTVFGNYDTIQQPLNISEYSTKSVCFVMVVDKETQAAIKTNKEYNATDRKMGLWRIVTAYNLPYKDPRRNGKIPKMLSHRLFPNVRFSLWVDGKLQLMRDPIQVLERFLWSTNDTYAISDHYSRHDVYVEAERNKVAKKYDEKLIDDQMAFYKCEGFKPYSASKLPIVSDVPEGCVIIREHMPITNLFSCLWFNEVDRFTPRDQLSFAVIRDKITTQIPWCINMFQDCQRRNFVVQRHHKTDAA